MRLVNVFHRGEIRAAVRRDDGELVAVADLDPALPSDVDGLVAAGALPRVTEAAGAADATAPLPADAPRVAAIRRPGKALGVGLNYTGHAGDLGAPPPDEPAIFLKAAHTLTGPGGEIPLPPQSERVTAEAELALVIGSHAWEVPPERALEHVAGAVAVLDQTAEDILQRNPRYLVRSKNFPGFLAVGAELATVAALSEATGGLPAVEVTTVHNGEPHRRAPVARMAFSPAELVSFTSHVMPLDPGDLLCTGTPGAVAVAPGDVVTARVDGLAELSLQVTARGQ